MPDKFENILAVCSFLGTSGYNYHARGFFTALNKLLPVAIKNWSYDDNPYYLTNEQKVMMAAASGKSFSFGECITVCLHESNHEDWYKHAYKSPKIAFNVWESTRQTERFFQKLLEFDQIWVPSEWQKKYTVEQGAPADKVFVIPEGIDTDRFKVTEPTINYHFADKDKFTFTIAGRWEYRKATTEMIRTFNETFRDVDDVELLILVDNPFDRQKMSTEDKLLQNGLGNKKIKILHKLSQEDYDQLICETNCFLSCSRAEGWNLPLCFPVGTEIITPSGFKLIETIKQGDDVFSHKGLSRKVKGVMTREYRGDLINVDIYNNINTLSATPEHPVRVIKRNRMSTMYGGSLLEYIQKRKLEPEWIPIKEIEKGDLLVQAIPCTLLKNNITIDLLNYLPNMQFDSEYIWSKYSNNPKEKGSNVKKVNRFVKLKDLTFLIGWYLAEGNSYKTRLDFTVNSITEQGVAARIKDDFNRLFGVDSVFKEDSDKDALHIRISSSILATFFKLYCGGKQSFRFIPNEVLYGNIDILQEVISNLFLGDGCHQQERDRNLLTTCSEVLANQVVIALHRLGYKAGTQKVKRNRKCKHYVVSFAYDSFNGTHSNKQYVFEKEVWHFVKKVTKTSYEGIVYNFEVEKDNSYLTHTASVHNCEFMACGVPAICSNWSGHLEFAKDYASLVNTDYLKAAWSEFGDFPGEYAEPDFKHLGQLMLAHYADHSNFTTRAVEGAEYLKGFTWENAAKIALSTMKPLMIRTTPINIVEPKGEKPPVKVEVTEPIVIKKSEIKAEVSKKVKSKDIIVIDCFPNTENKLKKLVDTIYFVKKFEKPIALVSHLPIPESVQVLVDYYIFDVDNTLPDYRLPIYYTFSDLKLLGRLDRPYHSLPIVKSLQNICKMFSNFERIHFIEYDINIDFEKHLSNVATHKDKDLVSYFYEGTGIYTNIMTFKPSLMLEVLTTQTLNWEDYKKMASPVILERDLIFENWMFKILTSAGKTDNMVVLKSDTINMKLDEFKEMPVVNFVVCETEDDKNVLFVIHRNIDPKEFIFDPAGLKLISNGADPYSYVIFDRDITNVTVHGMGKTFDVDVVNEYKGEFLFFDGCPAADIKCKKSEFWRGISSKHNIQYRNFFIDGAFMELLGPTTDDKYKVTFTDRHSGQIVHSTEIGINCWTKTNRKYYTDWNVKVTSNDEELYNQDISYFQRRVFVVLDSKAMGDTLAWFPMVEEFRKKHNAHVICSSFWNKFFKSKYPEIDFIEPGQSVPDIFAQFNVGCYDNDLNRNRFNWRITPLQKVAADILGITRYVEVLPNVAYKVLDRPIKEKYVAISEHSTFMCKYWLNSGGWSTVINYLNDLGYVVAAISKETTQLPGIVDLTGKPIEETISNIHHSSMFIGMSSGPSWLSWALKKPLVLISGYSKEWAEMDFKNPLVSRVINKDVCHGCFNDPSLPLERGSWRWCPRGRDFECSKMISPEMVMEGINKFFGMNKNSAGYGRLL